ncbi:MAG TPA: hypothetical protein VGE16_19580, partial [Albitalea sp.]
AEAREAASDDTPLALAQRLGALSGGLAPPALVYFNATDADSGHIVWFSNRNGGEVRSHFPAAPAAAPDVTVGQAVLHSARFPIVSPAGAWGPQRLVDGGYADNSGTTTLLRVVLDDKPHGSAQPRLINIDGNPPGESECVRETDKPPILTAVRALLQARTAHADLAVQQFKQAVPGRSVDVVLDLEKTLTDPAQGERCEQLRRAHQAPLGWYVSYNAAKTMAASVDHGALQICAVLGEACALASPAAVQRP